MAPRNPPWTRDELILALDLYFRFNPAHISVGHPEVQRLSNLLNALSIHESRPDAARFRNPNGVYMKLCNFLRLDPDYAGTGLTAGSRGDEGVWNDFVHDRDRLARLATAIRENSTETSEPGSLDDSEEGASEGRVLLRQHKSRERNRALVAKKKASALARDQCLRCEVCGFVYTQRYGELGEGFIECHHTVPLSQLRPGQGTRLVDLALVCANCHRMLHKGGEALTVACLKERLRPVAA